MFDLKRLFHVHTQNQTQVIINIQLIHVRRYDCTLQGIIFHTVQC